MSAERVLAVFAHPDDESLLAGGTLAACAAAGLEVVLVCATRGEQGPIADPDTATRQTLGSVREAELRAAAHALGVSAVECLDYPDGGLAWVGPAEIVAEIAQSVRCWRPGLVITFGPEGLYWHPDHIAVHGYTMAALDTLADEGLSPWVYYATWPAGWMGDLVSAMEARGLPAGLWGLKPEDFGAPAASITTVHALQASLPAKLRALRCHRSQLAQDHLFHRIPDDLAEEYLGREYFVRARPRDAAADWFACAICRDGGQTLRKMQHVGCGT